ncbi:AAA family ATPase [Acetobacter oeni]|uniref:Site-determining protein n=2 Tax=Acetobacter oeni TaxID=304077 RepID=A0A511XFU2_9PROT|nr:AAA family ATPase [Acetobacter oeni]GEN61827.1 site-determining protein [Acetobacter oeni]
MSETVFTSQPRPYSKAVRPLFSQKTKIADLKSTPRIIAVASGKGGVGKTWFSLTLAHALLRENPDRRILVVDGDFGLGNVDIQLGLHHKFDITHILKQQISIPRAVTPYFLTDPNRPATRLQLDILPGHSGASTLSFLKPDNVHDLLEQLRMLSAYDIILIDLCAGIDWSSRAIAAAADRLLLVTTEEPTALTDAYAVLKLSIKDRQTDGFSMTNAEIVVNQATGLRSGEAVYAVLAEACSRFLKQVPKFAGVVRRDRRVSETIRLQRPFLGHNSGSMAGIDVTRIARRMSEDRSGYVVS